jgi:hypothetical protein
VPVQVDLLLDPSSLQDVRVMDAAAVVACVVRATLDQAPSRDVIV